DPEESEVAALGAEPFEEVLHQLAVVGTDRADLDSASVPEDDRQLVFTRVISHAPRLTQSRFETGARVVGKYLDQFSVLHPCLGRLPPAGIEQRGVVGLERTSNLALDSEERGEL